VSHRENTDIPVGEILECERWAKKGLNYLELLIRRRIKKTKRFKDE